MHRFVKKVLKKTFTLLRTRFESLVIVHNSDSDSEAELSSATYFCFDLPFDRRIAERIAGLNYAAIHKINGQPRSVILSQPSIESAHIIESLRTVHRHYAGRDFLELHQNCMC